MAENYSQACCTVPPVEHNYEGKGRYVDANGTRVYVTGPSTASTAILFIYDIFGFKPQTLQGADILAHSDKDHQYQVFIPDFFNGKPADKEWYPPDNKEKEEKLNNFFSTTGNPVEAAKRVPGLVDTLTKQSNGTIKKWGVVGLCWGGKITAVNAGKDTKFTAAAVAHPAMIDPKDASEITIPYALLPSGDDEGEDLDNFVKSLKVDHLVERYSDQIHGFLGARSNLQDPNVFKKYEQGYTTILKFFHKHL